MSYFRERSSHAIVAALVGLVGLYLASRALDLYLTHMLFQVGLTAILVALVVVFQVDLRRGFERMASWGASPWHKQLAADGTADILVEAAARLAQSRTGALMVLRGREPLDRHLRGGVALEGNISLPLILSIFQKDSPGHDGAVIINRDVIERFSVHLPLSGDMQQIGARGTRHAAGLGLAERTDALIIVVSEERGVISVAHLDRLEEVTASQLSQRLIAFGHGLAGPTARRPWWRRLLVKPGLKLAAVALAIAAWLAIGSPVIDVQRTLLIPIEYRNVPDALAVDSVSANEATVTLTASEPAFALLRTGSLVVSVDLDEASPGERHVALGPQHVSVPPGVSVRHIEPQTLDLTLVKLESVTLPVVVLVQGQPRGNRRVQSARVDPESVTLLLPASRRDEIRVVRTEPFVLTGLSETTSRTLELILPLGARFPRGARTTARATIEFTGPVPAETAPARTDRATPPLEPAEPQAPDDTPPPSADAPAARESSDAARSTRPLS